MESVASPFHTFWFGFEAGGFRFKFRGQTRFLYGSEYESASEYESEANSDRSN